MGDVAPSNVGTRRWRARVGQTQCVDYVEPRASQRLPTARRPFILMRPEGEIVMTEQFPRGRFVWHELNTTDPRAAAPFYTKVLPWHVQAWDQPPSDFMWIAGK